MKAVSASFSRRSRRAASSRARSASRFWRSCSAGSTFGGAGFGAACFGGAGAAAGCGAGSPPGRFRFRGLEDDEPGVDDVGPDDAGSVVLGRPAAHEREGRARVQKQRQDEWYGIVAEHKDQPDRSGGSVMSPTLSAPAFCSTVMTLTTSPYSISRSART